MPVIEMAKHTWEFRFPKHIVDRLSCEASFILPGLGKYETEGRSLVEVGG